MKRFFHIVFIAVIWGGISNPGALALDYDEAVSGDLGGENLGDLGPGRNTVRGSTDNTSTGSDNFRFNVLTDRQLLGAVLEVSNFTSPSGLTDVIGLLGATDNDTVLASGRIGTNGKFVLSIEDPQTPFPQPADNGYGGAVRLVGVTGSGTSADWEMGIITAGPTRQASIDPGPLGSTFEVFTGSTDVFNSGGFDGDGFVLNANFDGKALRFSNDGFLVAGLRLTYGGDPFYEATVDAEALSLRLIGTDGFDDVFLSNSSVNSFNDDSTPNMSLLSFQFSGDSLVVPDDFSFAGAEILGLLPTDSSVITDAVLNIGAEFGSSTSFTVIPEPSSLALLTFVFAAVALCRRR
ncbi:MAG: PEP-CTERM sorting domain-containing protein [Verrucomicrobiota bacterium]